MNTKRQNVMRKTMFILTLVLGLFFANAGFASTKAKPKLELRNSHVLSIEQSKSIDKVVNLKSKDDTIIVRTIIIIYPDGTVVKETTIIIIHQQN